MAVGTVGMVLGLGPEGWWDSHRVSSPQVLRHTDGSWRMWYYGRDASFEPQVTLPDGRVGLARSDDGIHWERIEGPLTMGSVFEPNRDTGRFDVCHVGISDIRYADGLYTMWYLGGDETMTDHFGRTAKGLRMLPGMALSRNGRHWVRVQGPYRGALLDFGAPGEFDELFRAWPRVVGPVDGARPDEVWRLYYHTRRLADGAFVPGVAVSPDGLRWTARGAILEPGAAGSWSEAGQSCRHVLQLPTGPGGQLQWVMVFEGCNRAGQYCLGLATSADGLAWTAEDEPILCHSDPASGNFDTSAVGTPCLVPLNDGSYRVYFIGAGRVDGEFAVGIGMAVSDGTNLRRFRRWNDPAP